MTPGTGLTSEEEAQHLLAFAHADRLVEQCWADPAAARRDWDAELIALEASFTADAYREVIERRAVLDQAPGPGSVLAIEEVLGGARALTAPQAPGPGAGDALGDGLVSAFAAAHRVAAYALWLEVAAAARLLTLRTGRTPSLPRRSRSGLPAHEADDSLVDDEVTTELALAAGITTGMAHARVDAAKALVVDERLPATAALLIEGLLDWARLAAVLGRTRDLTTEAARAVEALLYATPNLFGRGLTRFEHALDAALLTVDAEAVAARRNRLRRDRRVGIQTGRDGTAFFTATGPAEAVVAAYNGLDAAARDQRAGGDARTLDQLRFDLLVTATTSGHLPVPAEVLPVPTGCVAARDGAAEPSATVTARPPGAPVAPTGPAPSPDRPWFGGEWPRVQVHVDVSVSAETLMGLTDAAGTLHGYGPIPADAVRDLVTGGVFRCRVVDGTHGTVLGVGRSTFTPGYVPGAGLRLLAGRAFPVCDLPGCGRTVGHCDLDHQIPYAAGGPTCICNIRPLCRTHHRLKTAGLLVPVWTGPPGEPGSQLTWVTRTGRAYTAESGTEVATGPPDHPHVRVGPSGAQRPLVSMVEGLEHDPPPY